MTRAQQAATRVLLQAQHDWLISYGWEPQGKHWRHRKLPSMPFTLHDAMQQTRATPNLGWP